MRITIAIVALLLLPLSIRAQDRTLPPDPTVTPLPPVTGKGVQIYHCQQQQGTGAPAWVLVAPEATLYAGAEAVGTHSAGPTWRWKDGSAVTGKLLITQPAPDRASIPWLLLAASPAIDSTPTGMLAHVTYVRRSDTHGGMPPTGCDAHHLGAVARVPYAALYTFYKAAERPRARH